MTKKWVRKPVVIEAVKWTGDNTKEMEEFGVEIIFLDHIEVGSYVVKDEAGKFHLYSNSAFHLTFERHLTWEENI